MLDVADVEVRYGAIRALKGISFQVAAGEIVALLGANGAGQDDDAEDGVRACCARRWGRSRSRASASTASRPTT